MKETQLIVGWKDMHYPFILNLETKVYETENKDGYCVVFRNKRLFVPLICHPKIVQKAINELTNL